MLELVREPHADFKGICHLEGLLICFCTVVVGEVFGKLKLGEHPSAPGFRASPYTFEIKDMVETCHLR